MIVKRNLCSLMCELCIAVVSGRNGFASHFSIVWFLVLKFWKCACTIYIFGLNFLKFGAPQGWIHVL